MLKNKQYVTVFGAVQMCVTIFGAGGGRGGGEGEGKREILL